MALAAPRLLWSLVPARAPGPAPGAMINPPSPGATSARAALRPVDIEELAAADLFGAAPAAAPQPAATPAIPDDLASGARPTLLNLRLQGVLSAAAADAARAVIEIEQQQEQYAVGDRLPVAGRVTVAQILPDRVVLDNGGSYELLLLFEEGGVDVGPPAAQPTTRAAPPSAPSVTRPSAPGALSAAHPPAQPAAPARVDLRADQGVTQAARNYRERLYADPQSLSEVVQIAAVREGGALRGYRLQAGKNRQQFERLGFQSGDIVTGVNGVPLTDPGKAVELYRVMRSAGEASFNVLRDGRELTLVVGLGGGADG